MTTYDVLIVGGGLAGGSLALALEPLGLKVMLVEAVTDEQRSKSPAANRTLALARGSVEIFRQLELWPGIAEHATPIEMIHVSDRGHFGKTRLSADELDLDNFGHVITARHLEAAVSKMCREKGLEIICPARVMGLKVKSTEVEIELSHRGQALACRARLVVAADGGNSQIRQWTGIGQMVHDYHQAALVGSIVTEIPHHHIAFERFTESGPLAMLPLQGPKCAMIWTHHKRDVRKMLALSPNSFEVCLQETFGWKLGRLRLEGSVQSFPLRLIRAQRLFSERVALVGNAAHQLHPVAGQGFNLGLRDVITISRLLKMQIEHGRDPGAFSLLEKYAVERAPDHNRIISFSDGLIDLFIPSSPPLALARNIGLMALDHLPVAKRWFARHAMGMAPDSLGN